VPADSFVRLEGRGNGGHRGGERCRRGPIRRAGGTATTPQVPAWWRGAGAWADLLEEAISVFGAETVRKRLDASEFAVGGGFTPFATFLAKGGMPKAQATRCLSAWEDELSRDC